MRRDDNEHEASSAARMTIREVAHRLAGVLYTSAAWGFGPVGTVAALVGAARLLLAARRGPR